VEPRCIAAAVSESAATTATAIRAPRTAQPSQQPGNLAAAAVGCISCTTVPAFLSAPAGCCSSAAGTGHRAAGSPFRRAVVTATASDATSAATRRAATASAAAKTSCWQHGCSTGDFLAIADATRSTTATFAFPFDCSRCA
jgi:hypothetical protein